MICKCGSSDIETSSTVINANKDTLAVECSAAITCANCYRLLASGNAVITLNPFYHNTAYPALEKIVLDSARGYAK